MQLTLNEKIFTFFATLIEKICGISYSLEKIYLIKKELYKIAQSFGYESLEEFYLKIRDDFETGKVNSHLLREIVDRLVINETQFFRDFHLFEVLRKYLLPKLFWEKRKDRKISIWSAGCSTGQEPYSIAMILLEYFSFKLLNYDLKIWATDISFSSLEKAKRGLYSNSEIGRGVPVHFLFKYFKSKNSEWEIREEVKALVKFDFLNLIEAEKKVFEKFDLIFCRYVLIYFSDSIKEKIWETLWNSLNSGGCLILGATELAPKSFPDMEKKIIDKVTLFFKK